jgi:hypothetical protein
MRTVPLLAFTLVLVSALPAVAQTRAGQNGPGAALGGVASEAEKKVALPPPAAIPGARGRPDSVVPLKGGTTDLPPTEALFDAINRGDILTARDAINRGADLNGTNLLGLTPIELSVDLARNDISFLLLSLRGASSVSGPPPSATTAVAAALPTRSQQRAARVAAAQALPVKSPAAAAYPDSQAPKLFAQDGGAPIPAAGFLGFDRH